jgi:hypothetical protein
MPGLVSSSDSEDEIAPCTDRKEDCNYAPPRQDTPMPSPTSLSVAVRYFFGLSVARARFAGASPSAYSVPVCSHRDHGDHPSVRRSHDTSVMHDTTLYLLLQARPRSTSWSGSSSAHPRHAHSFTCVVRHS